MTNLPITANTSIPPGKSGNAPQAGNGAASGIRRTAQRSFAEAISAHRVSAVGLPAVSDTLGEIPVSFSDVLNRHIGSPKTDSVTGAASGLFPADSEDVKNEDLAVKADSRDDHEAASASAATTESSGIVSSMMHQVIARQPDSATADTSNNVPVEHGMTRKGHSATASIAATTKSQPEAATTASPTQPELATRDSLAAKALPVDDSGENAPHTDEITLKDTTKPAVAIASGKQSDSSLAQISDQNKALESTAKPISPEMRSAPGREKQSVQNTPQLASDKSASTETAPLSVNAPGPANTPYSQTFSRLTARPGDTGAGPDGTDRSNTLNIPKAINTTHTAEPAAAGLLKTDHGRAPVAINVSAPLGSSDWPKEFSQKIIWMGDHKNQVAELHLNPPDLGPLDVVLKVSGNQATAQFTSTHSAVRDAVENAIPKLREMLAENGVTLGNTSVSDQPPQYRGADGSTGQGSSGNSQQGTPSQIAQNSDPASTEKPVVAARQHNGLVDTFA